jgi:acetyl esterase/lipase
VNRTLTPLLDRTKGNYAVQIESKSFAGVPTLVVIPVHGVSSRNRSRVLVNVHGGGFEVGGGGVHGLLESIPISAVGQIKVVTVDYRMGPENVFPAASEDVATVYRSLLKDYPAKNIGIYGCSSGGVLAAQGAAWIQHEKLPRPGAIGIFSGSAFADFTGNPQAPGSWGGDSRYITAPLQGGSPLAILGPSAGTSTQVPYLAHVNVADPMVSPGVAPDVLAKCPPTLLVTGTRAYDMSAAVQTQRNLRKAGVEADLELWDGLGHCFFLDSDLPESKEMFEVVSKFFDRHLGG